MKCIIKITLIYLLGISAFTLCTDPRTWITTEQHNDTCLLKFTIPNLIMNSIQVEREKGSLKIIAQANGGTVVIANGATLESLGRTFINLRFESISSNFLMHIPIPSTIALEEIQVITTATYIALQMPWIAKNIVSPFFRAIDLESSTSIQ